MIRRLVFEIAVITFLSALLALGSSLLRRDALSWVAHSRQGQQELPEDAAYKSIGLERAKALHAGGMAVFIDARSKSAFEQGHIAGAINLDPYDFDQWSVHVVDDIQMDQMIVTYCDGAQCPLSSELAEKLTELGFEKVYNLKDGWAQWKTAGLPIEKGPAVSAPTPSTDKP